MRPSPAAIGAILLAYLLLEIFPESVDAKSVRDLFEEMRQASLKHRGVSLADQPAPLPLPGPRFESPRGVFIDEDGIAIPYGSRHNNYWVDNVFNKYAPQPPARLPEGNIALGRQYGSRYADLGSELYDYGSQGRLQGSP